MARLPVCIYFALPTYSRAIHGAMCMHWHEPVGLGFWEAHELGPVLACCYDACKHMPAVQHKFDGVFYELLAQKHAFDVISNAGFCSQSLPLHTGTAWPSGLPPASTEMEALMTCV